MEELEEELRHLRGLLIKALTSPLTPVRNAAHACFLSVARAVWAYCTAMAPALPAAPAVPAAPVSSKKGKKKAKGTDAPDTVAVVSVVPAPLRAVHEMLLELLSDFTCKKNTRVSARLIDDVVATRLCDCALPVLWAPLLAALAGQATSSTHNAFLCNELMRIAGAVLKKFNGLADGAKQAVMQELPQLLSAVRALLTQSISHASQADQDSKQWLAKRMKGITGCAREVVDFIAKAKVLDAGVDSAFISPAELRQRILLPCRGLAADLEQLISAATSGAAVAGGAASSANDAADGGEGDGQMKQQQQLRKKNKKSKKAKKDEGPEGAGGGKSIVANNVVVQLRQAVDKLCGITEVEGGGGGAEASVSGSCNGAAAQGSASKPSTC